MTRSSEKNRARIWIEKIPSGFLRGRPAGTLHVVPARHVKRAVIVAALAVVTMAALVVPAYAVDERRVADWSVEIDSGLATFSRSIVATDALIGYANHSVYYGATFDEGAPYVALGSVAFSPVNYARSFGFGTGPALSQFSVPLLPEYRFYLILSKTYVNGVYEVDSWTMVVNDAARVVVEQDEPMPVRLAELGANGAIPSEVPSTGVPVSIEASVVLSLDESGTVPVSVKSAGWLDADALTVALLLSVFGGALLLGSLPGRQRVL